MSFIRNEIHFRRTGSSRGELQMQGWCVLRFAGREILNETDAVVRTIEQAIRRQAREREDQEKQPRMRELRQTLPIGGAFAAGAGRGGSVDDTGRVPFPHTFLSFDLWLIALFFDDSPVNSTTFRNRLRDTKKAAAEMEVDGKVVMERDTIDHKRGVKAWWILQVRQQKFWGKQILTIVHSWEFFIGVHAPPGDSITLSE